MLAVAVNPRTTDHTQASQNIIVRCRRCPIHVRNFHPRAFLHSKRRQVARDRALQVPGRQRVLLPLLFRLRSALHLQRRLVLIHDHHDPYPLVFALGTL